MVDAERRLLGNALRDPDNQHFVLLSDRLLHDILFAKFLIFLLSGLMQNIQILIKYFLDCSCIPLRDFDYVFNYLMYTNVSFIDW